MTDRAGYMSSRLVYPVSSPWAARRRGEPTAYLSARQRAALLYVATTQRYRGKRTLEEIARALGVTSRGQMSRELRRLRQLELIGYRTRQGAAGWHSIWMNRRGLRLRAVRRLRRGPNDSASTPFGGFLSPKGLRAAWSRPGGPPLAGLPAARDGPRRGTHPPRTLSARCPEGHPTRLGRRSWTQHALGVVAEWSGACRICARPIVERVEVAIAPPPPRGRSTGELADPQLLDRRRRMAALFEADGIRSTIVRAYRDLAD